MIKVNITGLYNLVIKKSQVESRYILDEAKAWYKAIKLEGAKHVVLFYYNEDRRIEKRCSEVEVELKAMAAFVVKLYYRWDDDNSMRLEQHFDLPTQISNILNIKKLTNNQEGEYKLITIRELVKNYLK